jgi:hypothetical protein
MLHLQIQFTKMMRFITASIDRPKPFWESNSSRCRAIVSPSASPLNLPDEEFSVDSDDDFEEETEYFTNMPHFDESVPICSFIDDAHQENLENETVSNAAYMLLQMKSSNYKKMSVKNTRRWVKKDVYPPIGFTYPKRLALPNDSQYVNDLHAFVREELLEIFLSEDGSGKVGIRCVHCSHLPRSLRVPYSHVYPKSIRDLYRQVCTWQRIHFRKCKHIPQDVNKKYWKLKHNDKTRGKTSYWASSARDIGLVDIQDGKKPGVCFSAMSA